MGEDSDLLGQPDARSAVLRAGKDISFGSIAGIVSKVFEHPFDLCKVRLQTQVLDQMARFSGPVDCLTKTWKNEGFRGLYRGLPAPIVGAMAENSCLFLSYNELQNLIRWMNQIPQHQDLSLPQAILAAAGAGALTSFALTPIELVKCKMQVQMLVAPSPSIAPIPAAQFSGTTPLGAPRVAMLPGPMEVLKTVIKTTGFRGLWLGQTGTLIRETGGSAAWFGSKEFTAGLLLSYRSKKHPELVPDGKQLTRKDLLLWESALSGASAGVLYNLALFPADTVKSTIQTEEELRPRAKGAPRPTFFGTLNQLYVKQGLKGLYAGCGITIARAVPSSGLIFLIYDGLCKKFP
ncbi:mitochondrial carrier [Thelephora ganbajun]|uniref:Mitochondrial carrier n=1 Tax=Thelephora ganbajun TaxID=370292 RepID=A0ACB6ZRC1_THEGA|nr:mitochondrial carrier [Thelephora ganbajun]